MACELSGMSEIPRWRSLWWFQRIGLPFANFSICSCVLMVEIA